MTYGGGAYGGTVFTITTGGTEKMLHSFGQGTDGRTLYGTSDSGGVYGRGTIFSLTP